MGQFFHIEQMIVNMVKTVLLLAVFACLDHANAKPKMYLVETKSGSDGIPHNIGGLDYAAALEKEVDKLGLTKDEKKAVGDIAAGVDPKLSLQETQDLKAKVAGSDYAGLLDIVGAVGGLLK